MASIRIGTSGWSYRHWRGVFYPEQLPQSLWLAWYAERFPTVELNTTFYGTPAPVSLDRWSGAVPDDFVFAVKANRVITHRRRLVEPAEPVARDLERLGRLDAALGPVLFQLPPQLPKDLDRLTGLLDALPSGGRYAVEFRHESWDDAEVYALLGARGVAVCLHDKGRCPWPPAATRGGASFVYARFHGVAGTYTGRYDTRTLKAWAARCERWRAEGRDVFCYFNNDAGGSAVFDALALRRLLGEDVPRTLLEAA